MRKTVFTVLFIATAVLAGPGVGGRVGYTTSDDPFTGMSADGPIFGGQLAFPLMPVLGIEISGTYTSTESDISMESYLANYLSDEYGYEYNGNIDDLRNYLENELEWTLPAEADMLKDYRATYHNLGLAAILRADIPMGSSPFKPYVGGGGGVHFVVSDADAMLGMLQQQATGDPAIDPYDHVFPSAEGVIGMSFKPAGMPASLFGEIRLSKPFGDDAGEAIVSYFGGANLGF
ncbi:MAG: hypothetical protein J7K88_08200 [Candidatus Fermentibacteraceae bacterium]|nr:hypothetical protein [Candidatus Fermentibacteraceae bacterium]